ncbi:hypothetical protein H6776_02475 [Candidatus Nomurabacteria bacterium]|nr:hypothetical protein [Candidatus Nomurabacteria bacterium]
MYILHLIPLERSTHREELSYFSLKAVPIGSLVEAPYGKRILRAIVSQSIPLTEAKTQVKHMSFQLKNIHRVIGYSPLPHAVFAMVDRVHQQTNVPRHVLYDLVFPKSYIEYIAEYFQEHEPSSSCLPQTVHTFHTTLLQQSLADRLDVYVSRAREIISKNDTLVIFAPSVLQVEMIGERVSRGVSERVILLHSHMTKKQLQKRYEKILSPNTKGLVIVTTPYFLGALPQNVSLCIVHDASSAHYLSTTKPYVDMKHIIHEYTQTQRIECMYSDTLLPLALTYHAQRDPLVTYYTHASYHPRGVVQTRRVVHNFSEGIFHPDSIDTITRALAEAKTIGLYVPRTGYASVTKCNDCGHIMSCVECDAPVRLSRTSQTFSCGRCGVEQKVRNTCQVCDGMNLVLLGTTIEKVSEALDSLVLEEQRIMVTASTVQKKSFQKLIHAYPPDMGLCVVGTSALLNLSRSYDVMIIVSAAHLFAQYDYDSYEQSLRLRMQLQERTTQELIIQTPDQYRELVDSYIQLPITEQLQYEKDLRKDFLLPPFTNQAHIIVPAESVALMKKVLTLSQRTLEIVRPTILSRMPYTGYRGGMCIEISWEHGQDIQKILDTIREIEGVYFLRK